MSSDLRDIPISEINIGERFRKDLEVDDEFVESIKEKGILQPISVTPDYVLIAGGRRVAGAVKAGLTTIPAIIRETDGELDLRECELIENAYRKDFTWLDRNNLVRRINDLQAEKYGERGSQRRTAELLNKSVGGISRHVALNKALMHFPDLAKCKTEDEAVKLFRKLSEKLIVKQLTKQLEERTRDEGGEDVGETGGETETPIGITLAKYASHHYTVGDVFDGLQEMIDRKLIPPLALVEIDPPYGIDLVEQKKGEVRTGIGEYNEIEQDAYPDFLAKLLDKVYAATPKNCRFIIWFGNEWYGQLCATLEKVGFQYDRIPCVWVKPTGQTASPDNYLARSYESFIVAWKGTPAPIAKRGRSNVFAFNPETPSTKYHPTQRPLPLMQEILRTFAWPGSVIMVPFLGSGATLRAGYSLGISGFGWDLSSVYKENFLAAIESDISEGRLNEIEV